MRRSNPRLFSVYNFALILLLAALLLPWAGIGAAETQHYISDTPLTVYESADLNSAALRELAAGEPFEQLSSSGGFAQIASFSPAGERLTGWVSQAQVRPLTAQDGVRLARVVGEAPAQRADLRTSARSGAKSLGRYYQGVLAHVVEQPQAGWVKLRIGTLEGFMQTQEVVFDPPEDAAFVPLPEVTIHNPDHPGLTMRAAQSFQSEKAGNYANGSTVRVLGVTDEFAHVLAPDGKVGFMMVWALTPQPLTTDTQDTAPVPAPQGPVLTVDNQGGQGAQLRTKSSTSSASLGLYRNGAQVILVKWGEYWSQVWVDGKTGYMMTKFLLDPAAIPQGNP